ncbi:VanW family protein [Heyndrickxia sp. NPDC080065]|uniref:VanW family protein n=1 Tax=Heyndrickxia sp. NPDC080065 TaxID=3390568 RepID=UPI003D03AEEE
MKVLWLSALLMIGNQSDLPDNLFVTHEGNTIANVNRVYFSNPLIDIPLINQKNYKAFLQNLNKTIYKPPTNATIDDHGNIVSEKVGYKLNHEEFKRLFYTYFFNKGSLFVEAPLHTLYPHVDSELLSHIRVNQIGHYATYFNSNNKERSNNILLASKAIDNHVVFPGETFSFNKVVGKRTKEKGYLRAPVIVRGEMSEDIGGGICQISSTLFNAVDNAGLAITERYSHSKRVAYVPPGRDATVSWYGPDFRFTNKYTQPILIRSKVYGGTVRILLYSSDAINNKQRKIPSASYRLPKEVPIESEVNRNR